MGFWKRRHRHFMNQAVLLPFRIKRCLLNHFAKLSSCFQSKCRHHDGCFAVAQAVALFPRLSSLKRILSTQTALGLADARSLTLLSEHAKLYNTSGTCARVPSSYPSFDRYASTFGFL